MCNYEQVLRDILPIERCRWDLIILDEGQRIKNWQSKTARVIKGLRSPFALVLSGTPLENRLDELYSIVQFVDDRRLAPAFRFFNRHRMVDERGRVLGYKNLDQLRATLKPVLLRRTRQSVLRQLPPRTTEMVRIPPTAEQVELHNAHMQTVAMIVRRPYVTEMDLLRLKKALLMCRMAADSTYLVDKKEPAYSTKLARLAELLDGLFAEPDRKAVLFSEWTTMLNLIEPLLARRKLHYVRLDGSVPQTKRQQLVNRFLDDEACRLFITTNAGSMGLLCRRVGRNARKRRVLPGIDEQRRGTGTSAVEPARVRRMNLTSRPPAENGTLSIGWQNHWQGEGHIPEYSRLKHRLERLLELGHADAVVKLGRELIPRVMAQIGRSHDEGETAMAVVDCVSVVFDAVGKSSLPGPQKLLFAIDASLQDDYDVVGEAAGNVFDASWEQEDWSAVADELHRRLRKSPKSAEDSWRRDYQRDRISNWLAMALENAGRGDELLALYEAEARATNSYGRLVKYLIGKRRHEDAERWAKEGIEKTCDKLPGIASELAKSLCEVAQRRKRWDVAAAHAAWHFFERPGKDAFRELLVWARKTKCEKPVRAAALRFLETGVSPVQPVQSQKGARSLRIDAAWPLPVPNYLEPLFTRARAGGTAPRPHYDVLLDMAIAAKKPEEVLQWYDKMSAGQKRSGRGWGWAASSHADRVAAAVAKSHPERALEIYRKGLDASLPHANISAYESAAAYLKRMQPIMKSLGRSDEWTALLSEIREKYRNRPRFMEILDKLEGRTVLQSQKARRRRR